MNYSIIVISAHVKLESLSVCSKMVNETDNVVIVSTQYLFDNEKEVVEKIFKNVTYVCFADLMTDSEGEECDKDAFIKYERNNDLSLNSMYSYFHDLTALKNSSIISKIERLYSPSVKLVISDDLGIDLPSWLEAGYTKIDCDYYATNKTIKKNIIRKLFQKDIIWKVAKKFNLNYPRLLYVAYYKDKKIIFHGHLERAGYRINLIFKKSNIESFKHWLVKVLYVIFKIKINRKNVINLTTLHEYGNYAYYEMMDIPEFHNYLFQDGYLPPNDTCKYLFFYGKYSRFLTWDKLGDMVFKYHNIPSTILPCRNTFPLPKPNFKSIKKVLCVSSGAGDWTAIKNRSDEDKTVAAFAEMARRYPNIEFTYRCHPSWTSPSIQGVNSIQRVVEYFDWLGLPNIKVSSNIPAFYDSKGNVIVSHKRSSLESDLQNTDFIFGVHSISMIDGAMYKIPFASVNLSGRRNLWEGISDLGFPHCEDIETIAMIVESVMDADFQAKYNRAIENYNEIIKEN